MAGLAAMSSLFSVVVFSGGRIGDPGLAPSGFLVGGSRAIHQAGRESSEKLHLSHPGHYGAPWPQAPGVRRVPPVQDAVRHRDVRRVVLLPVHPPPPVVPGHRYPLHGTPRSGKAFGPGH